MITSLTLRNFKNVGEQTYELTAFDLLVGRNNSGKSTVLQALAIWQFCVDEFGLVRRQTGTTGIQVVLPNFTALPVPEFNLLWKERIVRTSPKDEQTGVGKPKYTLIQIIVHWVDDQNFPRTFEVAIRYHSPQTIYALPGGGWAAFNACKDHLPRIAYVPPFSGLEPKEKSLDIGPLREQVGKGQPGSVLRNLLLRVVRPGERSFHSDPDAKEDWQELSDQVERWFGVVLSKPKYDHQKDVHITVEYKKDGKAYDLISGGSGFHQTMTLLAFLYGYHPTTILLDEPDAHLHVNLQREILDFFKRKSSEKNIQFLIATHAEEFVRGVDVLQIYSLLSQQAERVNATPAVLSAMSDVSNEEIVKASSSRCMIYVEGEDDERLLRAWAVSCSASDVMKDVAFFHMHGGDKKQMIEFADKHFSAIQQMYKNARRLVLLDWDSEDSFHPSSNNPVMLEWSRKNIENYLLVESAWIKTVLKYLNCSDEDLISQQACQVVRDFFANENLTLPAGKTWREANANIFSVVDGKKILFGNASALFHQLRNGKPTVELPRHVIAENMTADELHNDIHNFFDRLRQQCNVNASDNMPTFY
jgi:predicted ATPase